MTDMYAHIYIVGGSPLMEAPNSQVHWCPKTQTFHKTGTQVTAAYPKANMSFPVLALGRLELCSE